MKSREILKKLNEKYKFIDWSLLFSEKRDSYAVLANGQYVGLVVTREAVREAESNEDLGSWLYDEVQRKLTK